MATTSSRPDWEQVVTPVVDYLLTRTEVDSHPIALAGRNWGGYLAPRAASAKHRLAACIADPGLLTPGAICWARTPAHLGDAFARNDEVALAPVFAQMRRNPMGAFTLNRGMLVHGVDTPLGYLRAMQPYTLQGRVDHIHCPTLVTQAENDIRASQSHEIFEALHSPKLLVAFSNGEGAGEHCESGAAALHDRRMLDWLDGVLGAV